MTAASSMMPATSQGKVLALAERPNPKAARNPCTKRACCIVTRPRRGPGYRWYPMSWMTPVSDIGGLLRGEELGDAVASLVQAVQRKVQLGDGLQDPVVRVLRLERHQEQPALRGD